MVTVRGVPPASQQDLSVVKKTMSKGKSLPSTPAYTSPSMAAMVYAVQKRTESMHTVHERSPLKVCTNGSTGHTRSASNGYY